MKTLYPKIRGGGMGVNISSWLLAKTISMLGQIGTLSGVALETVLARILQKGDPGGHLRKALSHFPFPEYAERIIKEYFIEGGKKRDTRFKDVPSFTVNPSAFLISLTVCANFAFVWLAKEGHENPISINYLEKVSRPHIYAIAGAMLAGVDEITMGAGMAFQIPEVINNIMEGKTASYIVPIDGNKDGENITSYEMSFNLKSFFGSEIPQMTKPRFLPIVSSNLAAKAFIRDNQEDVYGFVIELDQAGGHNAWPRKPPRDKKTGEFLPIYGPKDIIDYSEFREWGKPFWIGGAMASPKKLKWALSIGAKGIQVGSALGLTEESDMNPEIRKIVRKLGFEERLKVRTDTQISPTGYLFKVGEVEGTISQKEVSEKRKRVCDQCGLRSSYEKPDGTIGYRCPAEPVDIYIQKGGKLENTIGRGCLCNGLFATCDLGNPGEPAIVTLGDDLSFLSKLMTNSKSSYTVEDVINYLLKPYKYLWHKYVVNYLPL